MSDDNTSNASEPAAPAPHPTPRDEVGAGAAPSGSLGRRAHVSWLSEFKTWIRRHSFKRPIIAWRAFSRPEKIIFIVFLALIMIGVVWKIDKWYLKNTVVVPEIGGTLTEGVVGAPHLIYPILGDTGEADSVLDSLIFSSLLKTDYSGGLEYDLADDVQKSLDGKTYTVILKKGILWHDNQPLTADDVVYTVNLIQNPLTRSPLAATWQGINVEAESNQVIKFTLPNAYALFPENLTFKILPKHIWENIPVANHTLSDFALKPIGSGPYRFKSLSKDNLGNVTQYVLARNGHYYDKGPYLDSVILKFYNTSDDAFFALKKKEIDSLADISPAAAKTIEQQGRGENLQKIILPRYFAVFFNEGNSLFKDAKIRQALAMATDKSAIVDQALSGEGEVLDQPIPSGIEGSAASSSDLVLWSYDLNKAESLLDSNGWKVASTTTGTRAKKLANRDKTATPLSLTLTLPAGAETEATANILKSEWQQLGVDVNLNVLQPGDLSSAIQSRSYDALLFGEILNQKPDPFSFWDSSQVSAPGLNLSLYKSSKVDKLLEDARQTQDSKKRLQDLESFDHEITNDLPAIFLYVPYYVYALPVNLNYPDIKILNLPEDRFDRINEWYIKTTRTWATAGDY